MFWKIKPDTQDILTRIKGLIPVDSKPEIILQNGHVLLTLNVDPAMLRSEMNALENNVKQAMEKIRGVKSARVVLTAEKEASADNNTDARPKPDTQRAIAPFVKHIIAVASGKGGVGKSTVAANLAVAMALQGLRVGLLDADIYGPSVPILLGVRRSKPEQVDNYLVPVQAHGIQMMSMGFLVDEESPMVWRGPMVQSALLQMLRDVHWGTQENPLDVLVLDMPPGTGDTQLTIAQKVKLSGAIIVSTPQDVALLDTVKGVNMFQKVAVPILGIIQNMSQFCCPNCGHQSSIFGQDGAHKRADELGVRFLGDIPLDIALREASDQGIPAAAQQDHPVAETFMSIAKNIWQLLDANTNQTKAAPVIVIEEA